MANLSLRIVRAWLDSPSSGVVEFERDWTQAAPRLVLSPGRAPIGEVSPAPHLVAGRAYGYYSGAPGEVTFVLPLEHGGDPALRNERVFLAGDFNGWEHAVGRDEWRLAPGVLDGEQVLLWSGPADRFLGPGSLRFKFVTGEHIWLGVPNDARNAVRDESGYVNRRVDPARTGRHLWRFFVEGPLDLAEPWSVSLEGAQGRAEPLDFGPFFYELRSELPLGAIAAGGETVFRVFAPRARKAAVLLFGEWTGRDRPLSFPLSRRSGADGIWEAVLDQNLHGWFYWYQFDGVREGPGAFDPDARVLDPYALATVDRGGPGIVLDRSWVGRAGPGFATPAWQDLVIAEAHVRDLTAAAPVSATAEERRGFVGLRKWVESPEFYLHQLGVNCVELQPVQEFDNATPEEYHWGYMTNNFFAPESSYALAPAEASGIPELRDLVGALHRRGLAVILDVAFNHVGEPDHLSRIDRLYYFERDADGKPTNWSGCGNDLKAGAAMARRLIIDACLHLIEIFGVDGFRFDLAELLGVEVLRDVEAALKRAKPDVILIAEPWSFRGHIAGALRDTGWASWNDGYRDFLRVYVRGAAGGDRLEYFLRGSPWYFAKWPSQTVNYTESHDDRSWIDGVTENAHYDGFDPTANDRRRTHLMAAILFMSLGIPMISAGQDFLRSKRGVANTYQRGDLNALDYGRIARFPGTHAYFADWIGFRRSGRGRLLRHFSRPSEGFLRFFRNGAEPALAALYNADGSLGPARLLFAVNPTGADVSLPVGDAFAGLGPWRLLATHERFDDDGHGAAPPVQPRLSVAAMSCALWESEAGA